MQLNFIQIPAILCNLVLQLQIMMLVWTFLILKQKNNHTKSVVTVLMQWKSSTLTVSTVSVGKFISPTVSVVTVCWYCQWWQCWKSVGGQCRGVDSWLATRLESRLESHFCDSWLDSSHGPVRLATRLGLDPLTRTSHVESRSSHLATGRSWSETVETESVSSILNDSMFEH